MEGSKSKIVIFGGTGYIGKFLVKASVSLGHPTFVYTRPLTAQTSSSKTQLCKEFNHIGVTLVQVTLLSSFFSFYINFKKNNKIKKNYV